AAKAPASTPPAPRRRAASPRGTRPRRAAPARWRAREARPARRGAPARPARPSCPRTGGCAGARSGARGASGGSRRLGGMRGPMNGYVALLVAEPPSPAAGSLKGKRKYVKSAKAQLQTRLGASVAEVDHHELWQRATLTAAFVARHAREAE